MANMMWTSAQEAAINTHGKTLLVSAAAGSGKTATLTERIIRSLMCENGMNISRMLIVTYTRAAAAELKVKISKALSEALAKNPQNHHLAEQMMMLESAKICTIDAFYFDIVKSNFTRLGLSSQLRILDSAEMTLLYREEMENLIDELYEKKQDFSDFMDNFIPTRGADKSVDIFLSVYQTLLSYRGGVEKLREYAENLRSDSGNDFLLTKYGINTTMPICQMSLEYAIKALTSACDFFASSPDPRLLNNYSPAFQNDLSTATSVLDAIQQGKYEKAREILNSYEKLPLKAIRGEKDEYISYLKDLRSGITKLFIKLREDYFSLSQKDVSLLMNKTADVVENLYLLLYDFDKRVHKEKEERGICDFSDIRRYVLKLLIDENGNPTDIANDYKARFDEIYIDEYQDVDEVQDLIFTAISTPYNRFMVGDIKQSIYGFRGANSDVFATYKTKFPVLDSNANQNASGYSVFMSNNFRCDKNIIDFSNLVSSYLFSNCGESIGYHKDDDLIFSKNLPHDTYESPKVVVSLTGISDSSANDDDDEYEDNQKIYYEAEYVTSEISRLLASEKKANGEPIEPKDIAVLTRQGADIEILSKHLSLAGIPTQSVDKSNFFENPDILLMLSLLSVIDNPRRDIHLAGTLRSPFYRFSFDDLIIIRNSAENNLSLYDALEQYATSNDTPLCRKCFDFIQSLTYWREKAAALPVDKLIQKLYRELSILSLAKDNQENLLRLYEYARNFEANSFHGLYHFISYINEIIENGVKLEKDNVGAEKNAVHLITIHHSKGLEFPVCFLYGTGKRFSDRFKSEKIQFDPVLGLGLQLHDSTGFAYIDTPVRRAIIDRKLLKEREEEMRVLYVAMTRARERLYITATIASPEKLENKIRGFIEFGNDYGIYSASSYLEWIYSSIQTQKFPNCYQIEKHSANCAVTKSTEAENKKEGNIQPAEDPTMTELFEHRFSFVYPYRHVSSLPVKLSVSSLYPAILDETQAKELAVTSTEDAFVYPEGLLTDGLAGAAERGTATHTFLQFCDFDYVLSHGVKQELARLLEKKYIDERTARLCLVNQLELFFAGDLFKQIQQADKIWREQRFHVFLPASDFTQISEKAELLTGETIAVQGVIDLFFQDKNGDLFLVDYKTDFLSEEERKNPILAEKKLVERHKEQLTYYKKAIEFICGKPPKETLIYSLPLGKTFPI